MVDHEVLRELGQRLCEVQGVVGVLLGGSRARGEHTPESDFDLGLYYRPPLDIDALEHLARDVAGPEANVTRPGGWGPWVDGGGWLQIGGTAVDWIYRDLNRVQRSWEDAQAGRYDFHFRAQGLLAHLGTTPGELSAAITLAADLLADTTTACQPSR